MRVDDAVNHMTKGYLDRVIDDSSGKHASPP